MNGPVLDREFINSHLLGLALALGLTVSLVTAAATLTISSALHHRNGVATPVPVQPSSIVAPSQYGFPLVQDKFRYSRQHTTVVRSIVNYRQQEMERNDFLAWQAEQHLTIAGGATDTLASTVERSHDNPAFSRAE